MKFYQVVPLAAVSSAFVLPSQELFSTLSIQNNPRGQAWYQDEDVVEAKDRVIASFRDHFDSVTEASKGVWQKVTDSYHNAVDRALECTNDATVDFSAWLDIDVLDDPHHGPPHHGPPDHDHPPRRPHGPHHPHHKPNQTIYQMIAESKYTTELARLISEYDDLVDALNSTKANITIFAPTDRAFKKIPEHAPKPSKEQLKDILSYHVIPDFYPAGRVLVSHTAPTLLQAKHLAKEPKPQRIAFKIGLGGLSINFYARVVAINIFATNGVIHGVDSIILPPPPSIKILDIFPQEFSTLELGLAKTGLLELLNTTEHAGGTLFAPNNAAFQKLGPRIVAFLFSPNGLKYLKALLEYHVVPDNTLYSDAYYKADSSDSDSVSTNVPKGVFHVDLPTLLEDRSLGVDIARYGGFIEIKINGFTRVAVQDGIAEDGVIHTVSDVIIPPKKLAGMREYWEGGEMSLEELKERLAPFVPNSDL